MLEWCCDKNIISNILSLARLLKWELRHLFLIVEILSFSLINIDIQIYNNILMLVLFEKCLETIIVMLLSTYVFFLYVINWAWCFYCFCLSSSESEKDVFYVPRFRRSHKFFKLATRWKLNKSTKQCLLYLQ